MYGTWDGLGFQIETNLFELAVGLTWGDLRRDMDGRAGPVDDHLQRPVIR